MDRGNVGNMNGYYDRGYSSEEMRRMAEMNGRNMLMGTMASDGLDTEGMMGNPALEQMMQDNKEMNRRRSFHHSNSYGGSRSFHDSDPRRSSMMEFGSQDVVGDLEGFQFDPMPATHNSSLPGPGGIAQRRMDTQRVRRQHSSEDLGLSTDFSNMVTSFSPMAHSSPYQNLNSADSMNFDMFDTSMAKNMLMGMDFSAGGLDNGNNGNIAVRNPYSSASYATGLHTSPIHNEMPDHMVGQLHDPGGGHGSNGMDLQNPMGHMPGMQLQEQPQKMQSELSQPPQSMPNQPLASSIPEDISVIKPLPPPQAPPPNRNMSADAGSMPGDATSNGAQQVTPQYRNAYSSSGFDMLGVLMRVATRPNPQINIGAVDMSCAFVVCDVQQHDIPIVYCSDVFERLTAYTKHEILGRNCRFLQAPDGKIRSGVKRKYVDDQSVLRIKKMITARQETQISLINYRKGGQPFMNLLTMIPITWDTDEVRYYVGFQVDLVEQPSSVTNKNPDGSYTVNYNRGMLPRYTVPDSQNNSNSELDQTVHRDDVSTVLSTIGSGESDLSKRIWDKMLLENTDDVVHVLSLKGLFLYLSPSSRRVLEYNPAELVGTALSSVCHPSDIVPVTRELKDTSNGAAVNVVFRIRRKHSGYTWFESHGSLHLEQGKGRKCIIMVGRERPVYALARSDVETVGGIGESELWTKMSTSGMFLYVSSNVRSLLDRQPEDLVGTSAQCLMRQESRVEFGKQLELARTGVKATFKHDVQNKRGQTLQARTTVYPGDACEGSKPTFLVAQTRLLKLSRILNRQPSNISPKPEPKAGSPASSTSHASGGPKSTSASGNAGEQGVTTQAGGSGLVIGNQHEALASDENVFDELKTTRSTSWQFELRQMEKRNRLLAEELQSLLSSKKKRKRRNGAGNMQKDCANCHTRVTPEWRRGPSGNRDLCNSCGLRWAKENGRVTPRTSSQYSDKSASPRHSGNSTTSLAAKDQHQQLSQQQQQQPTSNQALTQQDAVSPQGQNTESHNSKVARMEADPSQGFGGGIPPKIEEGIE